MVSHDDYQLLYCSVTSAAMLQSGFIQALLLYLLLRSCYQFGNAKSFPKESRLKLVYEGYKAMWGLTGLTYFISHSKIARIGFVCSEEEMARSLYLE